MKKVLLVVMSFMLVTPVVQGKDKEEEVKVVLVKEEDSDNYYYEGVVAVEGVTKEEMFKRAKEWVLSTFKTGDNNAQFDEKELIIYNTPTLSFPTAKGRKNDLLNFKIKVQFKDGKYKFRFDNLIITDFTFTNPQIGPYNEKKLFLGVGTGYNKSMITNINKLLFDLTVDLESAVKASGAKKDDW